MRISFVMTSAILAALHDDPESGYAICITDKPG
jgi:hypothetical protein